MNAATPLCHVIATSDPLYRVDVAAMRAALGDAATVDEFSLPRQRAAGEELEQIVAALEPADGLLVRIGTLSREIIERLPRLKVVALHGVGVDQVDVAAASEHGIYVTNVPGGNTPGVVELTIGLMIAMLRRIPTAGCAPITTGTARATSAARSGAVPSG